ncbi:type III-B CRISPR module RAMP protein Cmr6 [Candidatus Sumerlaeota bacterium]|nr:type III-B CRISPR module RAMP protein Cmr6 [Candidatus Sumerlaeota bacterium]
MTIGKIKVEKVRSDKFYYVVSKEMEYRISSSNLTQDPGCKILMDDLIQDLPVEFDLIGNRCENVRLYSPLSDKMRDILKKVSGNHPGLFIDKYAYVWHNQESMIYILNKVKKINNIQQKKCKEYEVLLNRRRGYLNELNKKKTAQIWQQKISSPLLLHSSRTGTVENANLCFHPLYGFVYIPGSGIKGMTHAWAETVWLPGENRSKEALEQVERIFGWSKKIVEKGKEILSSNTGHIIFHEAWPTKWPKIFVDITNCHYKKYYGAEENDNYNAPGDWEDPNPVNFLAVKPDGETAFEFAISKRNASVKDADLERAKEWVIAALEHLGAGGKTNSGNGVFSPPGNVPTTPIPAQSNLMEFDTIIELGTPAFLAGSQQQEDDCNLRGGTLRGMLRYWWRTLHADHVSIDTLRRMERAVWGSTLRGSPVQCKITSKKFTKAQKFYKYQIKDLLSIEEDVKYRYRVHV